MKTVLAACDTLLAFRWGDIEEQPLARVTVAVTDTMFTLTPEKAAILPQFPAGDRVELVLGGEEGVVHFAATVAAAPKENEKGVAFALPETAVQRTSRREFPRVRIRLPITLRVSPPGTLNLKVSIPTTTVELSAGGFRATLSASDLKIPIADGDQGECELPLDPKEPAAVLPFKAIWTRKLPGGRLDLGAKFHIDEREREPLIKLVYKIQADKRRLR